jgi:hypothetical protein
MQTTRPGGRHDGFKRLQRIGNDAAANNNLMGCAHKISGWPQKGAKGAKEFSRAISQQTHIHQVPNALEVLVLRGDGQVAVDRSRHAELNRKMRSRRSLPAPDQNGIICLYAD